MVARLNPPEVLDRYARRIRINIGDGVRLYVTSTGPAWNRLTASWSSGRRSSFSTADLDWTTPPSGSA